MQSNTQFLNFGINLTNLPQFQIPILFTAPVLLNGADVQAFQNFGGTSLSNASKNSLQTFQKQQQIKEVPKQRVLKRSSSDKKTNWSQEEDQILKYLVQEQKLEWVQIVKRIPNRTYKMCYSRYQRIKEEKKVNWSQAEQNKIQQLVSLFGKRWKHISQLIPNRTPKQIRERYLNHLRPNISHDKWTAEEDLQLVTLIKKYGRRWKTIERHMNKRSQNQLKNRYYGKLKKNLNKNNQEIKIQSSSLSE